MVEQRPSFHVSQRQPSRARDEGLLRQGKHPPDAATDPLPVDEASTDPDRPRPPMFETAPVPIEGRLLLSQGYCAGHVCYPLAAQRYWYHNSACWVKECEEKNGPLHRGDSLGSPSALDSYFGYVLRDQFAQRFDQFAALTTEVLQATHLDERLGLWKEPTKRTGYDEYPHLGLAVVIVSKFARGPADGPRARVLDEAPERRYRSASPTVMATHYNPSPLWRDNAGCQCPRPGGSPSRPRSPGDGWAE
jgi:hypothetical protein